MGESLQLEWTAGVATYASWGDGQGYFLRGGVSDGMVADEDRWSELWATFSVEDHVRPESFVAEVLLYDKLLIPVVASERDGLSHEEAAVEWRRWSDQEWQPARQKTVLDILGDRAEPVAWTTDRRAEWQDAMKGEFTFAHENGFFRTGHVLQRFAPALAKTVVAVPQYANFGELRAKQKISRRQQPSQPLPEQTLLSVLGFELLVPEITDGDGLKALQDAVDVSRDETYRAKRRALYEWQRNFIRNGQTDVHSIETAVSEMFELAIEVQLATRADQRWKGRKRFFSFMSTVAKMAGAVYPPASALAKGGEAFAGVGTFVLEGVKLPLGSAAATLVADAREQLGMGLPF